VADQATALHTPTQATDRDAALLALIVALHRHDYRFVTPTPATHARIVARPGRQQAHDLAGIFGWSLPFREAIVPPEILHLLHAADALEPVGALWRATLRVSSLHGQLLLHSAYPTEGADSVFFGPDSYRFADLIAAELAGCGDGATIVDIGAGAGAGAIVAGLLCPGARIIMTDVNRKALRFARINARAAGLDAETVESADLAAVAGPIDLALANPPYLMDDANRTYRDGGGALGAEVALDMAEQATDRLSPGGRLILYSGSAIVDGADGLRDRLARMSDAKGMTLRYRELDPDIFGEELDKPAYAQVDRIALVAAVLTRPAR